MPNILYIPFCNPVPFYQVDVPQVAGKNFIHLDEDWFSKQIQSWEQSIPYFQKWQLTDHVDLQIQSDMGPIRLDLIDCSQLVAKTVNFETKPTIITGQPWQVLEASMQLADVDPGYYWFLITAGFGDNILQFISEPLDVANNHAGTTLFKYKNTRNSLDMVWATGINPSFRCEANIGEYAPGSKTTVYEDQVLNLVELSAFPYDQFKLQIGGSYGVPNWVAKRLNMIFCNDTVLIDGRQYVKADGAKLEPNRIERYPMSGWTMDIRPASNRFSGIYDATFDDETAITYNIEAGIFGTMNDLPTNNQIVIIEKK